MTQLLKKPETMLPDGIASGGSVVPLRPGDDTPTILTKAPELPYSGGPSGQLSDYLHGSRLAHFHLEETIGVGGMAAVIRARDVQLDRHVALKILPPDMASDPDTVRRFMLEAKAAAKLDHENIARVFFAGEDQGLNFIAFEFVEGRNIRARIEKQGCIPILDAIQWVMQIASGLAHATRRGVVHRDIKPSNIIINEEGRAKLVDMGLARSLQSQTEHELTQSGVTLGTFDYISPEQAMEPRDADVRSDIYSLGCTLYHMLTGYPPVPEGTAARKLQFHQNETPTDPRELNPQVSDELAAILARMMAKNPAERYQSPEAVVQHLQMLVPSGAQSAGSVSSMKIDPIIPASPQIHPLTLMGLAGLAVVLLVVFTGSFTASNQPEIGTLPGSFAPTGFAADRQEERAPPPTVFMEESADSRTDDPTSVVSRSSITNFLSKWLKEFATNRRPGDMPTPPEKSPDSRTAGQPVSPRPIPDDKLYVDGVGGKPGVYETLESALGAIEQEGTIILHEGGAARAIRPLDIGNRRVIIKAAPDESPLVRLNPDVSKGVLQPALFQIREGGNLELDGLGIVMESGPAGAKHSSAFRVAGGGTLSLKSCHVTLHGGEHLRFQVVIARDAEMSLPDRQSAAPRINIEACFFRGDGDLLNLRCSAPPQINISNCLIALNGSFLIAEPSEQGEMAMARPSVEMDHVTAYLTGHVAKLQQSTMRMSPGPGFEFSAEACIFVAASGQPLFHVEGTLNEFQVNQQLHWRGLANIYDASSSILSYAGEGGIARRIPSDVTAWENLWSRNESQPRFLKINFAGVPSGAADLRRRVPNDFKPVGIEVNSFEDRPLGPALDQLPVPPPRDIDFTRIFGPSN